MRGDMAALPPLFYKAIVQHPDGGSEILIVHAEDDVQFVRTLVNHADVDPCFAQGGKNLAGNAS